MAQFLIRKRKHFAEDAKPQRWSDLKWKGRSLRGDVVEVRETGYWRIEALGIGLRGWDRNAFALIEVPTLPTDDARMFHQSYRDTTDDTPPTKWAKARFRVKDWESLPWSKHTVTVNGVASEEWHCICADLSDLTFHDKGKD